jgi:hypothetical protein
MFTPFRRKGVGAQRRGMRDGEKPSPRSPFLWKGEEVKRSE